jgi:hypothetical protein
VRDDWRHDEQRIRERNMSGLINNSEKRKEQLQKLILKLHQGSSSEDVRTELVSVLKQVPYGEVVEVEQKMISEGILTEQEVLKFCDLHTEALGGNIDLSAMQIVPPGHPVDTFKQENKALLEQVKEARTLLEKFDELSSEKDIPEFFDDVRSRFNNLMDVDKHYLRKENLLFPFLEKHGITGPPKVMWGKDDEIRELLKGCFEGLETKDEINPEEAEMLVQMVLLPTLKAMEDMVTKEEEILLPMSLDKLTDMEWYQIQKDTPQIGFCLYDPPFDWKPGNIEETPEADEGDGMINLPSGNMTKEELVAILNTLPVDITFVDKGEKVRFFSQNKERIFTRNRSILNRDVKMCHPPSSVSVVEKIQDDFRNGREDHAPFWINLKGRFIHIEYFALRGGDGEFLGTLEVSQDLTGKRALEGEQRILSYAKDKENR